MARIEVTKSLGFRAVISWSNCSCGRVQLMFLFLSDADNLLPVGNDVADIIC